MGLVKSLRNIGILFGLASCTIPAKLETIVEKDAFSPADFYASPYVSVTDYQPVSGAKTTLVHIRQMHFVSKRLSEQVNGNLKVEDSDYLEQYKHVNDIQRDIYFFLSSLREKGVYEVWSEGRNDQDSNFNPQLEYNSIFRYISGLFSKDLKERNTDNMKFIPGAELLLAMGTGYSILPGDDYYLKEIAVVSLMAGSGIPTNVYKNREDHLVSSVANSNKPYAFCIYGGGHYFGDNVRLWNIANPDKKISFIEVTPRSFPLEWKNK